MLIEATIKDLVLHGIRPAKPSADFCESIKEQGVLHPIHVADVDGVYHVLNGHQRIAASITAGKATIPAVVMVTLSDATTIEGVASRFQGGDYFSEKLGRSDLYRAVVNHWAASDKKGRQVRSMAAAFAVGRATGEVLHAVCEFVSATVMVDAGLEGKWNGEALPLRAEEVKTNLLDFAALVNFRAAREKGGISRLWAAWREEAWRRETDIAAPPQRPEDTTTEGNTAKAAEKKQKADRAALTWSPKAPLARCVQPLSRQDLDAMGDEPSTVLQVAHLAEQETTLEGWCGEVMPALDSIIKAAPGTKTHNVVISLSALVALVEAAEAHMRQQPLPYRNPITGDDETPQE